VRSFVSPRSNLSFRSDPTPLFSFVYKLLSLFCPSGSLANPVESVASKHFSSLTGGSTLFSRFLIPASHVFAFCSKTSAVFGLTPMKSHPCDAVRAKPNRMISFHKTPGGGVPQWRLWLTKSATETRPMHGLERSLLPLPVVTAGADSPGSVPGVSLIEPRTQHPMRMRVLSERSESKDLSCAICSDRRGFAWLGSLLAIQPRTSNLEHPIWSIIPPHKGILSASRRHRLEPTSAGGFYGCDRAASGSRADLEFHSSSRRISHLRFCRRNAEGIHHPRRGSWRIVWFALWRRDRLRWPARRTHCLRIHPHLRTIHQHSARVRPFHHSRKQHRADHRLGGRIARRWRDVHYSGADFSRFRIR